MKWSVVIRMNNILYNYENTNMKKKVSGWMYILLCADGSYYTESTNDFESRILQHESGESSNHTKKTSCQTNLF